MMPLAIGTMAALINCRDSNQCFPQPIFAASTFKTGAAMNRNALVRYCPPYICAVAVAACALLSAQVQAEQRDVTIQVSVSTAGLDLSRPDAALALYYRLSKAAFEVCSNPLLVDAPSGPASASCYERTLGNAVRSARQPLLSAIYAKKHTQQAATNRDTDVASVPVSH